MPIGQLNRVQRCRPQRGQLLRRRGEDRCHSVPYDRSGEGDIEQVDHVLPASSVTLWVGSRSVADEAGWLGEVDRDGSHR